MDEESGALTASERQAIKEHVAELRAMKGVKGSAKRERELQACLDAIAALEGLDQQLAECLHRIVTQEAPDLDPKTWYGFPSYARDGQVLFFVQPASKFGTRYPTVGFNEGAALDDPPMWPTAFAVVEVTDQVEQRLRELVRRARG